MKPDWVKKAEIVLHQELSWHTQSEYTGATCRSCGTGTDRLVVFQSGNVWCRRCGDKWWWDDDRPTTTTTYKQPKSNPEPAYWKKYVVSGRYQEWKARGITEAEVDEWGLGVGSYKNSNTLTIPVLKDIKLVDIRHRFIEDSGIGRYRSEFNTNLFNLDSLHNDRLVLLVEGEIKVILLSRVFPSVVGIPGLKFPIDEVLMRMHKSQTLILALDPGSESDEKGLVKKAKAYGIITRVASFFDKPDDVLLEYGIDIVKEIVNQA